MHEVVGKQIYFISPFRAGYKSIAKYTLIVGDSKGSDETRPYENLG
jgi:hypothetical protein